eukprot:scaffold526872_cov37-Prasinocladus_malaysianus.AAC.1
MACSHLFSRLESDISLSLSRLRRFVHVLSTEAIADEVTSEIFFWRRAAVIVRDRYSYLSWDDDEHLGADYSNQQ